MVSLPYKNYIVWNTHIRYLEVLRTSSNTTHSSNIFSITISSHLCVCLFWGWMSQERPWVPILAVLFTFKSLMNRIMSFCTCFMSYCPIVCLICMHKSEYMSACLFFYNTALLHRTQHTSRNASHRGYNTCPVGVDRVITVTYV